MSGLSATIIAGAVIVLLMTSAFSNAQGQTVTGNNLESPKLISPADNTFTYSLPIKFHWTDVPTAIGYELQFSKSPTFDDDQTERYSTNETSYIKDTIREVEQSKYYWRVSATDSNGNNTYSDVFSITLGPTPAYRFQFGEAGADNGQFTNPDQIAIDDDSNVYVTDYNGNRIQKFSSDGTYILSWGNKGTGPGEFNKPSGIIYHANFIYVSDEGNNRIQKFTTDGNFVDTFGSKGVDPGQLDHPMGMAIDMNGYITVADSGNNRIVTFTTDGKFASMIRVQAGSIGNWSTPVGIAVDRDGNYYVVDKDNHRVIKYDSRWNYVTEWGRWCDTAQGRFCSPTGISIDNDGNLYVSDSDNDRIQKFENDGDFVLAFGSKGQENGQFDSPKGLAIKGNLLYVADHLNNRIQVFDIPQPVVQSPTVPNNCSSTGEYCFTFENVEISKAQLTAGENQKINGSVSSTGKEPQGVVELHTTITEPDGNELELPYQTMNVVRGEPETFLFSFTPQKAGKYGISLEITPPDRLHGTVFDSYVSSFEVTGSFPEVSPSTNPEPNPKCPGGPEYCFYFEKVDLSRTQLTLGENQAINAVVVSGGTELEGVIYIYLTISEPDGNKLGMDPQIKTILKGVPQAITFSFTPQKAGKYGISLEITPPDRLHGTVFDSYVGSFEVIESTNSNTAAPSLDYIISSDKPFMEVRQGNDVQFPVSIETVEGSSEPIKLSCELIGDTGIGQCKIDPENAILNAGETKIITGTLKIEPDASVGDYLIRVTSEGKDSSQGINIPLKVIKSREKPIITNVKGFIQTASELTFSSQIQDIAEAKSIIWFFGDGSKAIGSQTATHIYNNLGSYNATLQVEYPDETLMSEPYRVDVVALISESGGKTVGLENGIAVIIAIGIVVPFVVYFIIRRMKKTGTK